MQQHLQAIVTVLSLVNPLMCGALFARIESTQSRKAQIRDSIKVVLAVLSILVLAALFGTRILHLFGRSWDAFAVAGGGGVSWSGFSMLSGQSTMDSSTMHQDAVNEQHSLTPVILFAASPGTITGVITLATAQHSPELPITALVAISVAVAVMWMAILLVTSVDKTSTNSGGFFRDTVSRFMGLIVIAMGIQFALSGIRAFMITNPT